MLASEAFGLRIVEALKRREAARRSGLWGMEVRVTAQNRSDAPALTTNIQAPAAMDPAAVLLARILFEPRAFLAPAGRSLDLAIPSMSRQIFQRVNCATGRGIRPERPRALDPCADPGRHLPYRYEFLREGSAR